MLSQFTQFLYDDIPLTKNMGLVIEKYHQDTIVLQAPLCANINDKGSVFGGSSSALMIIAAWSLIKLNCVESEIDADIVVHKNTTHWQKALFTDLIIKAQFKGVVDFEEIKQTITKKKHQRLTCLIELLDKDGTIYSTMTAKYVIIPKK